MEGRSTPRLVPVQIPNAKARAFPVLRYSAILLHSMPTAARRMRLSQPTTSAEVREIFKAKGCRATAAALGRELAVFGRDQEILDALASLGPSLAGTIDLNPVADSWAMGLLYDTLVRSLARQRPLIPRYRRSGHSLVVATPRDGDDPDRTRRQQQTLSRLRDAYGTSLFGTVPKLGFPFQEGVHLKLEQVDGKWWCGFEPYTFVQLPRQDTPQTEGAEDLVAQEAAAEMGMQAERRGDPAGDWRRERWAPRYNRNWASIIGPGPSFSPRRAARFEALSDSKMALALMPCSRCHPSQGLAGRRITIPTSTGANDGEPSPLRAAAIHALG